MEKRPTFVTLCLFLILCCPLVMAQIPVASVGKNYIAQFIEYEGALYFAANPSIYGNELYRYHPTTGLRLVQNIHPGAKGSHPYGFIEYQGSLYFSASDGVHGEELFRYHPSTGVSLVADINPGPDSSFVDALTVFNDSLYFATRDAIDNTMLWRYHPTTGVGPAADIPIPFISNTRTWKRSVFEMKVYQGSLYISADVELGITARNRHAKKILRFSSRNDVEILPTPYEYDFQFDPPTHFTVHHDSLYFVAPQDGGGFYDFLYRYHPSTGIEQVVPTYTFSDYDDLTVYDGDLYFSARARSTNRYAYNFEFCRYRPSTGTELIADMRTVSSFTEHRGSLVFGANDGVHGWALYYYHPSAGVNRITDFYPGSVTSPVVYDNDIYFIYRNEMGDQQLWKYSVFPCLVCNWNESVEVEWQVWQNDGAWTWAASQIDWSMNPDAPGEEGFDEDEDEDTTPEERAWQLSLKDEAGQAIWQQAIHQPSELAFDIDDSQPYLLELAGGSQADAPRLQLSAQLVPTGVTQVQMHLQPLEGQLSLHVGTQEEVPIPLMLSMLNMEGEVLWQTEFEAPFDGALDEAVDFSGSMLKLSVAGEEVYARSEKYQKATQHAPGLTTEVDTREPAVQVYPNPVVNHTLQLDVYSPQANRVTVEVVNLMGQQVLYRELSTQAGQQRLKVDMQGVPQGAYLLKVQQGQQQTTTRLLVPE